ncbi:MULTISPECIES: hypothetical protein [unclassified Dietzia]|uniref:hypothetical protein n=1 Tax=unclassified Dietzia TaxID=2617939 RepID=UPI0015F92BAF|nr:MULTISPECIES: hypothetical protein [unclassified Dietzia]MBB1039825.1 hypothetical protein [Dietzia sp. Cai40]MBB1045046.1 hypothetical protein [Dietzia sp. DQ11-44]
MRLAQAILPDGSRSQIGDLRYALRERGAFADVAEMWRALDEWIGQNEERVGTSTISANEHLSRIGFPISQAIARKSDKAILTQFFHSAEIFNESLPSAPALIERLRIWAHHQDRGLSWRFVEVLRDPALSTMLEPIVYGWAEGWDGDIVTDRGLKRLNVQLAVDIDAPDAWWVVSAPRGAESDIVEGETTGGEFAALLTPDEYSAFFESEGLPPVRSEDVRRGFQAVGEVYEAHFKPFDFCVMREDADAGGWISVESVEAFEEHLLVVSPTMLISAERLLNGAADSGWRKMESRMAHEVLPGFTIYFGVVFSDETKLMAVLDEVPSSTARSFKGSQRARPRFIEGLPLHRLIDRSTYLAGGEPDLVIPVTEGDREVEVTLDGDRHQTFRASIFPIPLSRFGPYAVGTHTVEADGVCLAFTTMSSAGAEYVPPGVGELGWQDGQLSTGSPHQISGGWMGEEEDPGLVLLQRNALESWLIQNDGSVRRFVEPEPPAHPLSLPFKYFEIRRDSGAWLLQRRYSGWIVHRLSPGEPNMTRLNRKAQNIWDHVSGSVKTNDRLWWRFAIAAWEVSHGR